MAELSTTQSSANPVGGCPNNCSEAMNMVMEDVNRATRNPDPVARNADITQAYRDLGAAMPDNHWVRLAGYVSTQGGCAMKNFYPAENPVMGTAAQTLGRMFVNPTAALAALKDANTTIFTSVFPPNKFMHECGYDKLKECVDNGELSVDPELMNALKKLDDGDLQGAADAIARHEQMNVVQPVYERHRSTFNDMVNADGWVPRDQTSIPVSYDCGRSNLVPLGDRSIQNPEHRVDYYGDLLDAMKIIEQIE